MSNDAESNQDQPSTENLTFHLVANADWIDQVRLNRYYPVAFPSDGFVHCTNGEAEVIETANRYYQSDLRPYLVLEIDLGSLRSKWQYDDPGERFPHVYGPIDRRAVTRIGDLVRSESGEFRGIRW